MTGDESLAIELETALRYEVCGDAYHSLIKRAIAALRNSSASRERMWCTACGTVTRDMICDCNRWPAGHEMMREPNFVNYADEMQKTAHEQAQQIVSTVSPPQSDMKIHAIEGIEVMEVIQIKIVAGTGKDDPLRPAFQYWSTDGALLAETDPHGPPNGGSAT